MPHDVRGIAAQVPKQVPKPVPPDDYGFRAATGQQTTFDFVVLRKLTSARGFISRSSRRTVQREGFVLTDISSIPRNRYRSVDAARFDAEVPTARGWHDCAGQAS